MLEHSTDPNAAPGRRRYHSPQRAAQAQLTRDRIRAAGSTLFLRNGYGHTSMSAVAKRAKVSEKTVYLAFPTKAALLSEVIRVAVRGDSDATPIPKRATWRELLRAPTDQILVRFAEATADIMLRTARVLAMAEAAAFGDEELAALRDQGNAAQRTTYKEVVAELEARGALTSSLEPPEAADIMYALANHAVFMRLTEECGWTSARYTDWLAATLRTALLTPTRPARRPNSHP